MSAGDNVRWLRPADSPASGLAELAEYCEDNGVPYAAVVLADGVVYYFGGGDDELGTLRCHYLLQRGITYLTGGDE